MLEGIPVNPWLDEQLKAYRTRHPEEEDNLSRALYESLRWRPFLQTLRANMALPSRTLEGLYWCHVDTVADLLQFTDEELAFCAEREGFDLGCVKSYLRENGYVLGHATGRTYKIPALPVLRSKGKQECQPWAIESPGAEREFDIARPLLNAWWCDRFFSGYGHVLNEEKLAGEFQHVKSNLEFREYFFCVKNTWDAYEAICRSEGIPQKLARPDIPLDEEPDWEEFPNERFLALWRGCCRVMVDIFERTSLFQKHTPGEYLAASEDGQLNIAEVELATQDFQLLLISFVENRVDFENILFELRDIAAKPRKQEIGKKTTPVNPWLEDVISAYRKIVSDDFLRGQYKAFLSGHPDASWDTYLAAAALEDKASREPFLLTKRADFGFSAHLADVMNTLQVEVVADLLQFTEEEMRDLCGQEREDIEPVVRFLASHGYALCHYDGYTLKYFLPEFEEARNRQLGMMVAEKERADAYMKHKEVRLELRLEKAISAYTSILRLVRSEGMSLDGELMLLIGLGRLMEDHVTAFPELTKDALQVMERALYCSVLVHGSNSSWTGSLHRMYGSILSKMKRHEEAAAHYETAAGIVKVYDAPDGLWVGKDLRSAGVCLMRIPDYWRALERFFQAAAVFKNHPKKPKELEETYWNISACYDHLGDKEKEEKYRLMAAAIRATDGI